MLLNYKSFSDGTCWSWSIFKSRYRFSSGSRYYSMNWHSCRSCSSSSSWSWSSNKSSSSS